MRDLIPIASKAYDFAIFMTNPLISFVAICGNSGKKGEIHAHAKMYQDINDPFHDNFLNLNANDTRVIKTTILDGLEIVIIYEICVNHAKDVAKQNSKFNELQREEKQILAIHEVISSSVDPSSEYILSETFLHNDVRNMKTRIISQKENPHSSSLFPHKEWIPSYVFEAKVELGSLIIKPKPEIQENEKVEAPLPESRNSSIPWLGKCW